MELRREENPMAKTSWQTQAKIESELASGVEIDMMVATFPELVSLWGSWCEWRAQLAQLEKLRPWTPRAARIEMRNIAVALQTFTPDQVATQMRAAIVGCWVGLNLDKMRVGPGHAIDLGRQGAW